MSSFVVTLAFTWKNKAESLRTQWPMRVPRLPLKQPALGQPWEGSANDCHTKAKCLAARQWEADQARLTWSLSSVCGTRPSILHRWPQHFQQCVCTLTMASACLIPSLTNKKVQDYLHSTSLCSVFFLTFMFKPSTTDDYIGSQLIFNFYWLVD